MGHGRAGPAWYAVLMRLLLALALAVTACGETRPAAPPRTSETQPSVARQMIASGATVIDVRTADEYAAEHLPNARHIPIDELSGRLEEVSQLVGGDKRAPIVVYCASGRRAAKAQQLLSDAGFQQVVNGGGLDDVR